MGEVEAVIAGAPGVVHAAATVAVAPAGGEFLVGYVSPVSVDLDAVKGHVAAVLPEYMRPSVWMLLDEVALNSAGKLDRRALPAPDLSSTVTEYVAPDGEAEEVLAGVFADVLGVERVGVTESFFDAGGNSLSAMRLVARAGKALDIDLSIADIFAAPSVRQLTIVARGRGGALPPVTSVVPRPDSVPLSYAQQRMWFINRLDPSAATYNIPGVFRLRGAVDVGALRQAVIDVVSRHEVLRTIFPEHGGVPHQVVLAAGDASTRIDMRSVASAAQLFADLGRGFEVTREMPIRVRFLVEGDDAVVLAVVVHHIAFDGQSYGPMVADLMTAYLARSLRTSPEWTPLPVQYADYALWQHRVLGSPTDTSSLIGQQLGYWTRTLAGVPDVISLPTDRPRPPVFSPTGERLSFEIPAEVARGVDAFASRTGASRFMVLHAVFAVLLARLSSSRDIVIGTPIDGRGPRDLGALVGMFVNTLALRTAVDPSESFTRLMERTRAADIEAFAHAEVPFESIVDALDPVRSEAFSPLVQVILSVDPVAGPDAAVQFADFTVEPFGEVGAPAQMDLNLTVSTNTDASWTGVLTFATALFDRSSINLFGERFVRLLGSLVAAPDTPVGDTAWLDETEQETVLAESAGPLSPVRAETIADAVTAVATRVPEALALISGPRHISYREFGGRVGAVARQLIAMGVQPGSAVGVVMDRSVELVLAVHAVIAAGGQYVPIAVDAPADRAEYMAAIAGVDAVLVRARAPQPDFVMGLGVPVVEVDAAIPMANAPVLDPDDRLTTLRPQDAAYTLFTSGSTGVPKGVTVTHGAVRNFVAWFGEFIPAGEQRLLFKTPHTFDASVLELFWPLVAGQTMVVAEADGERDPSYLAEVMTQSGVSVVQFVPSMLAAFLDVVADEPLLPDLQVLFSGGEALPPAVAKASRRRIPQAELVNLFGPTEAAVYTMSAVLDQVGEVVPIGRPMANTTALVLDGRLHPVPDGVAGELYLGGVQSARGYASRADLTAERFVADPFGERGARLYRTGDLVRRSAQSGDLEYLGRTDFQVKLRGQRLELGEVESAIAAVEGVVHAAARVVEGSAGDHLVGYVAPATLDTDVIARHLVKQLPKYMVPTVWVALAEMPLNTAGKVDRRSLPAPESVAVEYVAPETAAEETVAAVFAGLLGVDRVSVDESFFDAGGNSLAAMRLVSRVSEALGVQVSVRDVFEAPSVRQLVAAVADRAAALPPVTAVIPRPDMIPLSFAQQRMWFINRFDPSLPTYNIPAVLRISGELDVSALRAAVVDVVKRHEVLRTSFPEIDGVPFQQVGAIAEIDDRVDWAVVDSMELLDEACRSGFDVTTDWPLRIRLWPAGENAYVLAVVMHHIAADGESRLPFVTDLVASYAARAAGEAPDLAPLPVQFADFAIWQHRVLGSAEDPASVVASQLRYWRDQLAGVPDVLELPTDRPRPAVASHRGAEFRFTIPADVADRVSALARQRGVTPFMVVHASLSVLLARLTATNDIAVAIPVAGRGDTALDHLIGMFVNTLVLRTQIDMGMPFDTLVDVVSRVDLAGFAHAEVPFEVVVDALDPVRSEAFAPLAQVMLSFDPGASVQQAEADIVGLSISGVDSPLVAAQLDLAFAVLTSAPGAGWIGSITYATDLFDQPTIARLAERFVTLLSGLTSLPARAVGDVPFLALDEEFRAFELSAGPETENGPTETLASTLAGQILRKPDSTAVIVGDREVGYREFGARVAVLARELIAAGVGPDVAVGVVIERSLEMLVAVHAVIAAGGQYVPIDTAAPSDRIEYMLDVSGATLVLVAALAERPEALRAESGRAVIEVDAAGTTDLTASPVSDDERSALLTGDHAAYTLFTSGSTGRPKGVTVTQAGIVNRLSWMQKDYAVTESDRILQKTPYTFDVSVWELFLPLMCGASVVIAEPDGHRDPHYLAKAIAERSVSVVHFVPSMLSVFLEVLGDSVRALDSLRMVVTSGEALTAANAQALLAELPGVRLENLYGPTEAAVDVTAQTVLPGDTAVPIGRPVVNIGTLVLDSRLAPVPIGVAGELYLSGIQLARGYASRPELTAERFVADPYGVAGERLYRTGDRVRWNADGALEYLGRTDFQVKLRGQRIELGEVESVIGGVRGVVHAAVTVTAAPDGGEHLAAYISPATIDLDEVKAALGRALPGYMVPTVWSVLDELPLNAAGKIDRRALPPIDMQQLAAEYVAPQGDVEELVAAAFAEVLGVDQVSALDSFFDLGGSSLAAVRLAARLRQASGRTVELPWLFSHPTVRDLASVISGGSDASGVLIALRTGGKLPPLFCFPPANGVAWVYGGLLPYLDDRPVYGLQDPAVVADTDRLSTIDEFADRYIAEIRRVTPRGPYYLLGWSLGGVIAFAVAQKLRADGDEVAFLGLMDPAAGALYEEQVSAVEHAALVAELRADWEQLRGGNGAESAADETLAAQFAEVSDLTGLARRMIDAFAAGAELLADHEPGEVDAPVLFFTARRERPERITEYWRQRVSGDFVNIDVDVEHGAMGSTKGFRLIGPDLGRHLIGPKS